MPDYIYLDLDEIKLDFELNSTQGMVAKDLQKRGTRVLNGARVDVGVQTGFLRSMLHVELSRGLTGPEAHVGADVSYALDHHEGTRPHVIRAKQGRVLAFNQRGVRLYRRQVNHPGTRANPYLAGNLYRAVL